MTGTAVANTATKALTVDVQIEPPCEMRRRRDYNVGDYISVI